MNYGDNVNRTSAQQYSYRKNAGRAPGPSRYAAMKRYFGRPSVDPSHHYGENVNYTNADLFDLYKGKNLFLRDTLDGYILENIEWYTSVIPWLETTDHHIKFNTFVFNNVLATPTPNEGISRLITSTQRTYEDSVERYGIAFIMEGDLLGTPEGAEQYRRNIAGITQCCQETVNYHTLVGLLTCKDYYREMLHLYNRHRHIQQSIHDREAARFAVLALNTDGFDQMVVEEQERIRDCRGVADTLIVFPKFPFHIKMVQQGSLTKYWQLGPEGEMRFTEGPLSMGTYRGMPIHQTRNFSVRDNGEHVQPLIHNTTVGEYYPMVFGSHRGKVRTRFQIDDRSIYIYDYSIDDWKKMSFIDVLQQCRAWGPDGTLSKSVDSLIAKTNAHLAKHWSSDLHDRYAAPDTMDRLNRGESNPGRAFFAMVAVDAAQGRVFKADTIGQMDTDVFTSRDLNDTVNTALYSMFGDSAAEYENAAKRLAILISEWEREPGNEAYWEELSKKNITNSVTVDGKPNFIEVGHGASKTLQWTPNGYGGMDLPKAGESDKDKLPAGMANWGGMQTYAAQAEDQEWIEADSSDYAKKRLQTVRQLIEVVRDIANQMHQILMHSRGLRRNAIPDWFASSDVAEAAAFELLHTARIPLFLRLPEQLNGTAPGDPPVWVKKPHAVPLNAANLAAAWPMARSVQAVMKELEKTHEATKKNKISEKMDTFYEKFLKAAAHDKVDINAMEDARHAFDLEMFNTMEMLLNGDDSASQAVMMFANWMNAHLDFKHTNNKQIDLEKNPNAALQRLVRLQADLAKESKKWPIEAKNTFAKLSAAQKYEDKMLSAKLRAAFVMQDLSDVFEKKDEEAVQNANAQINALRNVLATPSAISTGHSVESEFRASNEKMARLARRYNGIVAAEVQISNPLVWGQTLARSPALSQNPEALMELSKAVAAQSKAKEQLTNTLAANASGELGRHFAIAGVRNEQIVEDGDIEKKKVFIRAPLTCTPAILGELAKLATLPWVLPANEDSGFRTPYVSLAGADLRRLAGHEMLRAHGASGFTDGGSAFKYSALGIAMADLPSVSGQDLGLSGWSLGGQFASSAPMQGDVAASASSRMNVDEFQRASMHRTMERASMGMAPRSFEGDFHSAMAREATAQRDRERAASLAPGPRANLLADPQPMHSRTSVSRLTQRLPTPTEAVRLQHQYGVHGVEQNVGRQNYRPNAAFAGSKGLEAYDTPDRASMSRGHFPYRWKMAQKISNPLRRAITKAILLLPNMRQSWVMLAENNVNPPCNLVIHRPWIEFSMFTCILLQSGYDTGFNAIGASNMALASSAGDKMLIGHFTFHHATMIINEKFVSHLRDVYPMGVNAGWDTRPFDTREQIYAGANRPSWIATFHPITENHFPAVMSLIDVTGMEMYPSATNQGRPAHLPHHSAAAFVEEEWSFNKQDLNWSRDFHRHGRMAEMVNVREFRGAYLVKNMSTGAFDQRKEGNGHLSGNRTGPKSKQVWNGYSGSLFPEQPSQPIGYF